MGALQVCMCLYTSSKKQLHERVLFFLQGTNYGLKCLVKSNSEPTNMLTYYVTFEATSAVDSDLDVTFQAKVH